MKSMKVKITKKELDMYFASLDRADSEYERNIIRNNFWYYLAFIN